MNLCGPRRLNILRVLMGGRQGVSSSRYYEVRSSGSRKGWWLS
jgi:hypothetical protein